MGVNKDRLVALTDGIIAIAATIMVLELSVPDTSDWAGFGCSFYALFRSLPVGLVLRRMLPYRSCSIL